LLAESYNALRISLNGRRPESLLVRVDESPLHGVVLRQPLRHPLCTINGPRRPRILQKTPPGLSLRRVVH
jgi:hypothetical protein